MDKPDHVIRFLPYLHCSLYNFISIKECRGTPRCLACLDKGEKDVGEVKVREMRVL